jgi:DNA-binding HxlR family transcriptional regulator
VQANSSETSRKNCTPLIPGREKDADALLSEASNGPILNVLDKVTSKWSLLVLIALHDRKLRFTELKRPIPGITPNVLAKTLRSLERDGYVARKIHSPSPIRVEYWLTPLGESLLEPICTLVSWASAHFAEVTESRLTYDCETRQEVNVAQLLERA